MGEMHKQVQAIKLEKNLGLIIFILSILIPGWSTIIAGFLASGDDVKKPAIIVGIIQVLTCWLLVGWVWSIINGWTIYKNSK